MTWFENDVEMSEGFDTFISKIFTDSELYPNMAQISEMSIIFKQKTADGQSRESYGKFTNIGNGFEWGPNFKFTSR